MHTWELAPLCSLRRYIFLKRNSIVRVKMGKSQRLRAMNGTISRVIKHRRRIREFRKRNGPMAMAGAPNEINRLPKVTSLFLT